MPAPGLSLSDDAAESATCSRARRRIQLAAKVAVSELSHSSTERLNRIEQTLRHVSSQLSEMNARLMMFQPVIPIPVQPPLDLEQKASAINCFTPDRTSASNAVQPEAKQSPDKADVPGRFGSAELFSIFDGESKDQTTQTLGLEGEEDEQSCPPLETPCRFERKFTVDVPNGAKLEQELRRDRGIDEDVQCEVQMLDQNDPRLRKELPIDESASVSSSGNESNSRINQWVPNWALKPFDLPASTPWAGCFSRRPSLGDVIRTSVTLVTDEADTSLRVSLSVGECAYVVKIDPDAILIYNAAWDYPKWLCDDTYKHVEVAERFQVGDAMEVVTPCWTCEQQPRCKLLRGDRVIVKLVDADRDLQVSKVGSEDEHLLWICKDSFASMKLINVGKQKALLFLLFRVLCHQRVIVFI